MKPLLFTLLLFLPYSAMANDKFWFSNKIEIGYDKIFLSERVLFEENKFIKNGIAIGLKFKLSDNMKYKTFYLLENARNNSWKNNHFLGMGFDLKLQ